MRNKITRSDSRSDVLDQLAKHLEAQREAGTNSFSPYTPASYRANNTTALRGDFTPCIVTGGIVLSDTVVKPQEAENEAF